MSKKCITISLVLILINCGRDDDSSSSSTVSCRSQLFVPNLSSEISPVTYTSSDSLKSRDNLTVMTRNLYVGADVTSLSSTLNDFSKLIAQVNRIISSVVASHFEYRVDAIVRDISEFEPEVVNLQEVALIKSGVSDFLTNPAPNATCVEVDFLEIITTKLKEKGLDYQVASTSYNVDVEVPIDTLDVRLTDRDVILVRSDISYSDPKSVPFTSLYKIPINNILPGAEDISVTRSYSSIMLNFAGKSIEVINTHLEAVSQEIRALQADELISYLDSTKSKDIPTLVVGDLNVFSHAEDSIYKKLVNNANLLDSWQASSSEDLGETCCYSGDLTSGSLGTRVDLVLYRQASKDELTVSQQLLLGNRDAEKLTLSNGKRLWPSDHAGYITAFSF